MALIDHRTAEFKYGQIDVNLPQSIPDGAAANALNWLTRGDHIELRRGSNVIGTEIAGVGRITGLHVAYRMDGTEVWFGSHGRSIYYYDTVTETWKGVGIGTDVDTIDSVNESLQNSWENSSALLITGCAQQFFLSKEYVLTSCKFYLKKISLPTGNAVVKIYLSSLQDGSLGEPTGSVLVTSNTLDVSTLTGTFTLTELTFATPVHLDPNKYYFISLEYSDGDLANYIRVGVADSVETSAVRRTSTDGSWISMLGSFIFYVYGNPAGQILPAAADGEDVTFDNYTTKAGAIVYVSSPNGGLFKIMTANPADYSSLYVSGTNHKGFLRIKQNRMWMWGLIDDLTGVYFSYIDTGSQTTVTAEVVGSGDGLTKTFAGTLAFRAGNLTRTCFGVTFTDGTETFTDNGSGVLTGSLGGSGTINYTTGVFSITFNTAPAAVPSNILSTYKWEDSNTTGVTDFRFAGTRVAGTGGIFRQDDGGDPIQTILTIGDSEYCFHKQRTWVITMTLTDTNATNLQYRHSVGIPYMRAAFESSLGIYYLDYSDKNKPYFRVLQPSQFGEVLPRTVSLSVNFEPYYFDLCAMFEWNEYIVWSGRTIDSSVPNRLFCYSKIYKSIDVLDYYSSVLASGNGTLISGESISNNFVTLFSGYDDSNSLINNNWDGNISELGMPMRMKRTRRIILEGNIQVNQSYDIYYNIDRGGFVKIGSVSGSGDYVDSSSIVIGSYTLGEKVVGSGSDGIEAFHYMTEIDVPTSKFDVRQMRFVATGIGYVSVSLVNEHDIRPFKFKPANKYRLTP